MAEINGRGSFNSMIINAAQFNNTRMYIKSWNENIALSCLLKSNLVKHLIQYGVAYLICKSTLRNIGMGYHFCQAISQFFDKRPVNRSGVNIVQQYGDKLIECVMCIDTDGTIGRPKPSQGCVEEERAWGEDALS